ncbi:hypothetical protein ACI7YW_09370 [Clostridium ljungdahlii]
METHINRDDTKTIKYKKNGHTKLTKEIINLPIISYFNFSYMEIY